MGELVSVVRRDGIAVVSMARPPVNAIAPDLLSELGETFTTLGSDASVRCIVLRSGLPRYFMAGADLGVLMGGGMAAGDDLAAAWSGLLQHFNTIERVRKPTIAAIEGHALGGGCEIALCCDYRVMVDDGHSRIGLTETALGLIPGAGGTQRLPRLVGLSVARRLIFEGTRLGAADALHIGLVDAAPGPDRFEAEVDTLAQRLAAAATRAIGAAKTAMREGASLALDEAIALETKEFVALLQSADVAEGVSAFFAKREPHFTGA